MKALIHKDAEKLINGMNESTTPKETTDYGITWAREPGSITA